ncbi:M48 family metalloprotease [Streptomyces sp. JJ36]|uniref:M48 family metalloprotease n=1 Tax=Streptomyces sp. JJ36 TaxID=2736645 RepID=UPI001F39CC2D|nr:M48 family metallopeptidase [Streptomyces sp. JJ36]MCF6525011.1 M48 family metalloprotease [Streptomyces sp. JJ36]
MGATLRAVRALVLLAGFYLLGFALLGGLAALDWAVAGHGSAALKIWVISALVAIPIVKGMFALRPPEDEEPDGIRVTEDQEPALWALVRSLAEQTGTRAPDEIYLVPEVNAAVSEESRLLGLRPGKRRLLVGLPLLTGLDEAQLTSVLAHEFGHYSNHDTRLSAITRRGWTQVVRTVAALQERSNKKRSAEEAKQEKKQAARVAKGKKAREVDAGAAGLTYRLAALPFKGYGHLYLRATRGTMRRQEYAADLAAARIAGRDATASALREIPLLSSAFGFYMDSYATLGARAGLLPPRGEVFGGLRHLLAARSAELDELRRGVPEEDPSPYDTHPPIADRVARIEQLPEDGRSHDGARPALALLTDAGRSLAELEDVALTPEARKLERAADWPALVHTSLTRYAAASAEPLAQAARDLHGGDGSLPKVLDALDAGLLHRLASSDDTDASSAHEHRDGVRDQVRGALQALTVGHLEAHGQARWELSWTEAATLRLPEGYEAALDTALDAAVADTPDTRPLRHLLAPRY